MYATLADPTEDPFVAYYVRFNRYPSGTLKRWIGDMAAEHGEARLAAKINATPTKDQPNVYLGHIRDALRLEDHAAEKAEAADEKARLAEKRKPLPDEPWRAEFRAAIAKGYEEVPS